MQAGKKSLLELKADKNNIKLSKKKPKREMPPKHPQSVLKSFNPSTGDLKLPDERRNSFLKFSNK